MSEISEIKPVKKENTPQEYKCPCSVKQLLSIFIPISVVALFSVIFLPVYLTKHKNKCIEENNSTLTVDEIDNFTEYIANYTYATLTPQKGYDNIYIHLGGISEISNKYFYFFKGNDTIIPPKTKIYFFSGKARIIKYAEKYLSDFNIIPLPCWFNVDWEGNLICDDCDDIFDEAKESLNFLLDKIDQIANEEKIGYDKIFLGGFSQGAIMVNYILLNSRHELGGYLAFSGYVFDHHFPCNTVVSNLNNEQRRILEDRKNYHILATHSFNDNTVFYPMIIEAYYTYYKDYTDFTLYSFGEIDHDFPSQPVLPLVKIWLKNKMGK